MQATIPTPDATPDTCPTVDWTHMRSCIRAAIRRGVWARMRPDGRGRERGRVCDALLDDMTQDACVRALHLLETKPGVSRKYVYVAAAAQQVRHFERCGGYKPAGEPVVREAWEYTIRGLLPVGEPETTDVHAVDVLE